MDMKRYIPFLAFLAAFCALSCTSVDKYVTVTGFAQGGSYAVKFNASDVDVSVEEISDHIDRILTDIDNSLSGYNRNSLVSVFNGGEEVVPDSVFIDIYGHAYDFYDCTGGVVDVASAPLFDLWGFGFKNSRMPDDEMVAQAKAKSGMGRLKRDLESAIGPDGRLRGTDLLNEGESFVPQLNYNAIAQGYSCDLVAEYLISIGVKDMMVDIGEIFCMGRNPSGQPWRIAIDKPVDGNNDPGADVQAIFTVPDGPHGVVTSGNYRKYYIRDGKKYAHTIDPRTGYPVSHNLLSATIVAPDAMTADAYATYCMAIGLDASKEFISSSSDLEGCLVYDDNGTFRVWASDGFELE